MSCSVLFFGRPRSEGWPHHERTFSIYICPLPLSDWLFRGESCPRLDVFHPGCAWSSSPACTWHCSLHYLFLQATPLFPHDVTIVASYFNNFFLTPALLRTHFSLLFTKLAVSFSVHEAPVAEWIGCTNGFQWYLDYEMINCSLQKVERKKWKPAAVVLVEF